MADPKRALELTDEPSVGAAAEQPRRATAARFRRSVLWTMLGTVVPGLGLWHAGRRVAGTGRGRRLGHSPARARRWSRTG